MIVLIDKIDFPHEKEKKNKMVCASKDSNHTVETHIPNMFIDIRQSVKSCIKDKQMPQITAITDHGLLLWTLKAVTSAKAGFHMRRFM